MSSMKLNIDTIKLQIMFEYLFSLFYFGRNPFFEIYFLSLNFKKWVSSKKKYEWNFMGTRFGSQINACF